MLLDLQGQLTAERMGWRGLYADSVSAAVPVIMTAGFLATVPLVSAAPVQVSGHITAATQQTVVSIQYQALAAPMATRPTFGWHAAPSPTMPTVPVAIYSATVKPETQPSVLTGWSASFQDTIGILPRVTAHGKTEPIQAPLQFAFAGAVSTPVIVSDLVVQYQAKAGPPPTSLQDEFTWQPEYADFARGLAPLTPGQTFWPTPNALIDEYAWSPEYPDVVLGAARPVLDAYALPPQQSQAVTTTIFWPTYPDMVATVRRAVEFLPSTLSPSPLGLWWTAGFTDQVSARTSAIGDLLARSFVTTAATPALSWEPWYPDWLPLPRPAEYPAFTSGAVAPAFPVVALSWAAEYPDQFLTYRARVFEGAWTKPVTLPPVPLSWAAEYADFAKGALWPVLEQDQYHFAVVIVVPPFDSWKGHQDNLVPPPPTPTSNALISPFIALTVDRYGWRGRWPDRLDPAARVAQFPPFATGATASTLPVPSLVWEPTYADLAPGRQPLPDWLTLATQPYPYLALDQLGWRGRWPDWLPLQRPVEFPAFTTGSLPPAFPVAALSWKPIYPDVAPGLRPLVEWTKWVLHPVPIPVPGEQFGWRGRYPDWLPLLRPADYPPFATGATASVLPVAFLSWAAEYPDRVDVAKGVVAPPFQAFDAFPRPDLTPLAWAGRYADAVSRTPLAALGWVTPQVSPAAVPELAWLGVYPPSAPGPIGLRAWLQLPWASGVIPSGFAPPALAWKGVWPDFAKGPRPLVEWSLYTWSEYELFRPPSPLRAWAPLYPDFARARPPLPVGAIPTTAGVKPLFFGGPRVMFFTLQRAELPRFVVEVALLPAVTTETAGQPKFDQEDTED